MLRTLATRKWIGLTVLALAVIVAFGLLSHWQWERAQRDEVHAAAVPASSVFSAGEPLPASAYGTTVTATGTYDADRQVVVVHGNGTYWVVTPAASGHGGGHPGGARERDQPRGPSGRRRHQRNRDGDRCGAAVRGDRGVASTLPAGQADRLTASELALPYAAARVDRDGGPTPAPAVVAAAVQPPVSQVAGDDIRLQNASYAVQWLLFAAFVVFFWVRMLREPA